MHDQRHADLCCDLGRIRPSQRTAVTAPKHRWTLAMHRLCGAFPWRKLSARWRAQSRRIIRVRAQRPSTQDPPVRRIVLLLACLAACQRQGAPGSTLQLRGALVPLIEHAPISLASCPSRTTEYSRPFWRAPYRDCGADQSSGFERLEVDADSVLTELHNTWRVDRAERERQFQRRVAEMARVLGQGRRCNARQWEWRRGDSLHAILQIVPEGDVGPDEASHVWKITRLARLGPLDATTWACKPDAPAL